MHGNIQISHITWHGQRTELNTDKNRTEADDNPSNNMRKPCLLLLPEVVVAVVVVVVTMVVLCALLPVYYISLARNTRANTHGKKKTESARNKRRKSFVVLY